jgi:hypothetical protein
MSIVNGWLTPERALVAVDTQARRWDHGKASGYACKLVPLVHVNAVIAFRGQLGFWAGVLGSLAYPSVGFDDLCETMRDRLDRVLPRFLERVGRLPPPSQPDVLESFNEAIAKCGQGIFLVGWSPKFGRMIARSYNCHHGENRFVEADHPQLIVAPWEAPLPEPTDLSSVAKMVAYTRLQVEHMRVHHPHLACGGTLTVATLSRSDMHVVKACDLDVDVQAPAVDELQAIAARGGFGWTSVIGARG